MRRLLIPAVVAAALVTFAAPRPAAASVDVSISYFQDYLSPHGRWVAAGSYGNCWVPADVAGGWAPYVDGEWVWTDYGWTWDSFDPWGDVVYHYGTWAWVDPYGWVWVPGTVWAPAWVTWAFTDDFIGWAPLPPTFVLSASGFVGAPVVISQTRYVFVPTTQFVGVNVSRVRVSAAQNTQIFTRATKVTNFKVSGGIVHTNGPDPARIQRAVGHPIQRVSIDRAKTKPTTITAAGARTGARLPIVAPASERARVTSKTAASQRPAQAPAATTNRNVRSEPSNRATRSEPTNRTVRSERPRPQHEPQATGHTAGRGSNSAPPPAHRVERGGPQAGTAHAAPPRGPIKKQPAHPNQGKEKERKD